MARKPTKPSNIFNKPTSKGKDKSSEPGFQGLIPFYFKRRRRPMIPNPIPPYRSLYRKPSMQRVGKWLAAQDKFFKNNLRWREYKIAIFYFLCGASIAIFLLLAVFSGGVDLLFKKQSNEERIAIARTKLTEAKPKALTIARDTKKFIISIDRASVKKTIARLKEKLP